MKKSIKRITAVLLAVVMSFMVVTCAFASGDETEIDSSNWMSAVDGSKYITQLNIPGTHDSATAYCDFGLIAQTQTLSIEAQLYAGARYFDMRLDYKNGDFYYAHGPARCKVSDGLFAKRLTAGYVVDIISDFLENNSGETILYLLKEENTDAGDTFFEEFYAKYIEGNEDLWYLENKTPTLDEARGKIILLRTVSVSDEKFNDSNSGINFTGYPYIGGTELIDFRLRSVDTLGGETYTYMYVQDSYKLEGKDKFGAVEAFWNEELDKNYYNINMTNCTGEIPVPIYTACKVNAEMMEYEFVKDDYYGIVGMDFVTEELCEKIYMNNELGTPLCEATEMPERAKVSEFEQMKNKIKMAFFNLIAKII